MAVESLGMIEVKGYLGAVVAADAALKAANVLLDGIHLATGGLATVLLKGDVAAVETGVDAGVGVVEDLGCLISHQVIARLDRQMDNFFPSAPQPPTPMPPQPTENGETETVSKSDESPTTEEAVESANETISSSATSTPVTEQVVVDSSEIKEPSEPVWPQTRKELEKKKVTELRQQAYQMEIKTMTKSRIKSATKNSLIKAILEDFERRSN